MNQIAFFLLQAAAVFFLAFMASINLVRREISAGEKCFGLPRASRPRAWANLFTGGFVFENVRRAAKLVAGAWVAQDYSLAAAGEAFQEKRVQRRPVGAEPVGHDLGCIAIGNGRGAKNQALLETAGGCRRVEHAIANLLPFGINGDLLLYHPLHRAELSPTSEYFAVQGNASRQLASKPVGSVEFAPLARTQLAAGPAAAKTIEFLAHQPAVDILAHVHLVQHTQRFLSALVRAVVQHLGNRHVRTITAYCEGVNRFRAIFAVIYGGAPAGRQGGR